jgi:hypothetical protein
MPGFLIAIGLLLLVVLVVGIRYDRRQRRMGSGNARTKGNARIENQTRADQWGGPGY